MAAAKTVAQRQKEFKDSKAAKGMREVHNLWAHKDDHEEIKAYAGMIAQRRGSWSSQSVSFNGEMFEPVKKWLLVGGEPPEWAKRDNGIYLAFDSMTLHISQTEVTQKFYYKGKEFFTKVSHLMSTDFQAFQFGQVQWMYLHLDL